MRRMQGRYQVGLLTTLGMLAAGCAEKPPAAAVASLAQPQPAAGRHFDAAQTGTVSGEVVWTGEVPKVPDLWVRTLISDPPGLRRFRPDPNAPGIDADSHGVGGAVVFLRGVDPERAAAGPHEAVRVVMSDFEIAVEQGPRTGRVGIVRRGDVVEMVSAEKAFHSLRASGAAFFTLPFPDPDQPARRRLTETGVVELSSGAGYFWMRAHLFVADRPCYAFTDERGWFTLPQVPAGRYELVCWMPNWHVRRHDRDPETGRVSRLTFAPPVELVQPVQVVPGEITPATFRVSEEAFAP